MTTSADLSTAAQLFTANDATMLKDHLKAIVAVEFLTIPLYLTAAYSFTEAGLAYKPPGGSSLYWTQQEVISVAVQEMLHLQLACNLCNAFGVTPQIPQLNVAPGEKITVPHLEPTAGTAFTLTIGNLPAVIADLIAIEKPVTVPYPAPRASVIYQSIAELYHATLALLNQYFKAYANVAQAQDPHFVPDNLQVNYATFKTSYPGIPIIVARGDVATVANAVVDQGEGGVIAGSTGGMFKSGPSGVLPQFQPVAGSRFARWGALTHYQRFLDVQTAIYAAARKNAGETILTGDSLPLPDGQPMFYQANNIPSPDLPSWAPPVATLQTSASVIWSYLTDAMQQGFQTGTLNANSGGSGGPGFGDAMLAFKYITPLLWQHGAVVGFEYKAGATGADAQHAMDKADPLSLFHWDGKTATLRAGWKAQGVALNACQGLNECKGYGWGGNGTQAGDGACATADMHTCGGNNDCNAQGGCGFLSTVDNALLGPADQWIPGENTGTATGGCQTPIGTQQVFDVGAAATIAGTNWPDQAKQELTNLIGTSVWQRARDLLATKIAPKSLPTPLNPEQYDGNARRAAIAPTSPK